MYPPPMMAMLSGTVVRLKIVSESKIPGESIPGIGGFAGREPVAMRIFSASYFFAFTSTRFSRRQFSPSGNNLLHPRNPLSGIPSTPLDKDPPMRFLRSTTAAISRFRGSYTDPVLCGFTHICEKAFEECRKSLCGGCSLH